MVEGHPLPSIVPSILVCDSDSLFQLLIANLISPLRELKRLYGVQPVITEEVEIELRSNQRYGKRVEPSVIKAISKGILVVLTPYSLRKLIGLSADVYYPAIQSLGTKYKLHVQTGEAYSHAAGVVLNVPLMSNDFDAIRKLMLNSHKVAVPTIRAFDLLVFSYQGGIIRSVDCDNFCHQMRLERNEYLPKEFQHASFSDGIKLFCPRLLDCDFPPIGSEESNPQPFKTRLLLRKIAKT